MEILNILMPVYMFIIGSIFASFFGVVISRVPNEKSIILPSSRCDNCCHVLKWYENIPILSYIFLKGKCSKCKKPIGIFSFVYEIIGGTSLLLVYLRFGISFDCLFVSLIVLILLLIAGYDYKTCYVLDLFLIILLALCFAYFIYRIMCLKFNFWPYIISIITSVAFFVILKLIMNFILKRESLGLGDIYIVGIIALVFEPFELILSIVIASLSGSIIEIIKIVKKKSNRQDAIPFCPYLCFGFYIILLYGQIISKLLLRY